MPRIGELVTGVLVTLNETENVEACINSMRLAGLESVILVDACSTDDTVAKAIALGAECHVVSKKGIAFQRQIGVDLVRSPYVLLADADNRLEPDCISKLLRYLEASDFAGVAAQKVASASHDYWSRAWEWNNTNALYTPGPKMVVGHPSLYKTAVLQAVRYNPAILGSADDTDLCFRLARAGFTVAVGPGVCREVMRNTFKTFLRKTFWYGKGDAEFFWCYPDRRWSIASHAIRSYFFKGQVRAFLAGRVDLMPFFALYGIVRWAGFWTGLLQLLCKGRVTIYKT
jgi:glycosyltransferase involved in cell wall biosynthesis